MRYFLIGLVAVILINMMIEILKRPGTEIYNAIRDRNHEKLKQILKRINPKKLDRERVNGLLSQFLQFENLTPLQYACNVGDLESVRLLVEAGANVNAPYRSYIFGNPLWYANNRKGNRDRFLIGMYLVDAGADCTSSEKALEEMMLLQDEEMNDEVICREQLDYFRKIYGKLGASKEVSMAEAYPGLLNRAAGMSGVPIVRFLIEEGYPVNPETDTESGHTKGETPLGSAAHHANVQTVEYLLSQGADIRLRDRDGKTALDAVLEQKKNVETKEWLKHERKRLGDYDRVIEILQQAGANYNEKS